MRRVLGNSETRSIMSTLASNFEEAFTDWDDDKIQAYKLSDPMLQSAWVNICVSIRARNIQRPTYKLYKNEREITSGPVYDLFRNPVSDPLDPVSASSLWYQTQIDFDTNGEFFWWFGEKYSAGLPKEIRVIRPALVSYEKYSNKWFYDMPTQIGSKRIELDPLSFVHVWEPNPWNPNRGVPPIVALSMELEQDIAINKEHLDTVKNSAIPKGLIRTEQRINPDQAQEIKKRWLEDHGRSKKNEKISVLGSGSEFQVLNGDLLKYRELKETNRVLVITKYGIPLKVVNAEDSRTALSGKDSDEQYKAFWSQTLIPHLNFLQSEIDTKFFNRFGLKMRGQFDLSEIPELQEDEADLHKRLREDIKVGLITINEARQLLHRDPVKWGDEPPKLSAKDEKEEGDEKNDEGEDKKSFMRYFRRMA